MMGKKGDDEAMEEAIARENTTPKNIGNISTSSSPSSPESGELGRNISNCAQIPLEKAESPDAELPNNEIAAVLVDGPCGLWGPWPFP